MRNAVQWLAVWLALGVLGPPARGDDASAADKARKLAEASQQARQRDPMLALLLAREAFKRAPTLDARTALYDALTRTYERTTFRGHKGPLTAIDLSADERRVLTASQDGSVRLWTLEGEVEQVLTIGKPVLRAHFLADKSVMTMSKAGEETVEVRVWSDAWTTIATGVAPQDVHFSPARNGVLVQSAPGTWLLWNTKDAKPRTITAKSARYGPRGYMLAIRDDKGLALIVKGRTVRLKKPEGATNVVFDPYAARVLAYGPDTNAVVYDVTGKAQATLRHDKSIRAAAFSENGTIVTASGSLLQVWERSGAQQRTVDARGKVDLLTCSPRGHWVASVADGTSLTLWPTGSWKPYAKTTLKDAPVSVEVDLGGGWTTVRYADGSIEFLDIDLSSRDPFGDKSPAKLSQWDPRQFWNLNAAEDGRVVLMTTYFREPIHLTGHTDTVVAARFAREDPIVLTASRDGTARLWELHQQGTPFMGPHLHEVWAGEIIESADRILTLSQSDWHLWDLGGKPVATGRLKNLPNAWSAGKNRFAITCRNETIGRAWDLDGVSLDRLDHDGTVDGVAFSPKGQRTLTWSKRGKDIRIYNAKGTIVGAIQQEKPFLFVAFGRSKDRVLSLGPSKTARVWTSKGKIKAEWRLPESASSIEPSTDGKYVLTLSKNRKHVRVFDEKGKQHAHVESEDLQHFEYDARGRRIVTASKDKTARLWAFDGKLLATMQHDGPVTGSSFFAGGTHIATGCGNQMFLWDTGGRKLATLSGHVKPVVTWSVSDSGKLLMTCSQDKSARLWPISDEGLAEVAEVRSGRTFTEDELVRYRALLD